MSEEQLQQIDTGDDIQEPGLNQGTQGVGDQHAAEDSTEARARQQGWRPDKFPQGDPRNKSAEQFIQDGENNAAMLRAENRRLEKMLKVQARFAEHQREQYEQQIEDLNGRLDEAVQAGDVEGARKIMAQQRKVEKLAEDAKEIQDLPETAAPREIAPAFQTWAQRNPWFKDSDPNDMNTKLAVSIANEIREQHKGVPPELLLQLVDARMDKLAPDRHTGARRESAFDDGGHRAPAQAPGGARASVRIGNQTYTFNDLPREAKAQCEKLVDKDYTVAHFLKDYFGD